MLKKELEELLLSFDEEFKTKMVALANETAKECANEVKMRANTEFPAGVNYSTGQYARAWTYGKQHYKNRESISAVVYARAPHYRLTHLLENGHRIVDRNGKTHGYKEGKPHIKPVAEKYEDIFYERMKQL